MALHGSLQQVPLRELIDLAAYSALSGSLDIQGERSGRIFFTNGQMYHVECEGQIGTEALGILLNVQQGTFNVSSGARSSQQSIWGDIATMIRYAERMALRWRRVWHRVSSLKLIPTLKVSREEALPRASVALHLLLEAIDGRKSLSDIATDLHWSAIDVVEGIVQLMDLQIVDLVSVSSRPVESHQNMQAATPSAPTTSIDYLLSILQQ